MRKQLLLLKTLLVAVLLGTGTSASWADETTIYSKALSEWSASDIVKTELTTGKWYNNTGTVASSYLTGIYVNSTEGMRLISRQGGVQTAELQLNRTAGTIVTIDAVWDAGSSDTNANTPYNIFTYGDFSLKQVVDSRYYATTFTINGKTTTIDSNDKVKITETDETADPKIYRVDYGNVLTIHLKVNSASGEISEFYVKTSDGTILTQFSDLTNENNTFASGANYETVKTTTYNNGSKTYTWNSLKSLTVKEEPQTTYNYTVNGVEQGNTSNILAELASGSVLPSSPAISHNIPWYVLSGNTLYYQNSKNRVAQNITSDNQAVNVEYTAQAITDCVFYVEGENIANARIVDLANASNHGVGCNFTNKVLTNLSAGKYVITALFHAGNGAADTYLTTATFKAGDTTVGEKELKGRANNQLFTSDEFILAEATNLTITLATNNATGVDYIYVRRIGDATVSRTISDAKYATYCSPYALDFSGVPGLKAYIAVKNNSGDIEFTQVSNVPANTGVLLKGDAGNYAIPVIAESTTDVDGNEFVGVTQETEVVAAGIYVLLDGDSGVGFYKTTTAFTVGANTAYLPATVANAARKFIAFDGGATAIKSVKSQQKGSDIYNLQGQRVKAAKRGLYIVNGKKVIK